LDLFRIQGFHGPYLHGEGNKPKQRKNDDRPTEERPIPFHISSLKKENVFHIKRSNFKFIESLEVLYKPNHRKGQPKRKKGIGRHKKNLGEDSPNGGRE
jgi:hypothetical protein